MFDMCSFFFSLDDVEEVDGYPFLKIEKMIKGEIDKDDKLAGIF